MNFAKIENSPRLKRLFELLQDCGERGATTQEIIEGAHVCAVSAAVSELRRNGLNVACSHEGKTPTGAQVYRYRLVDHGPMFYRQGNLL